LRIRWGYDRLRAIGAEDQFRRRSNGAGRLSTVELGWTPWSLLKAALAMGRKLMRKVVTIVKPDTILAWQRRLERKKWD
jgi:hypothetical protein